MMIGLLVRSRLIAGLPTKMLIIDDQYKYTASSTHQWQLCVHYPAVVRNHEGGWLKKRCKRTGYG